MVSPTQLITLGTAAGPAIRGPENGISSALMVGDAFYMVDFGLGCVRAAHQAGLRGRQWRAGFLTHLHSDHVAELPAFLMFNWGAPVEGFTQPVQVLGPGADPHRRNGGLAGTRGLVEQMLQAYAYDIDIRITDEARPDLSALIRPKEIAPPDVARASPGTTPKEAADSIFTVFEDDRVLVTATLVDHPPVYPALAYRFDTEGGSVTFSGDTAECPALARLALDTDVLVHEAVNLEFYADRDFSAEFLNHQARSHTTPEGAGRIAAAAGAKKLVLSHLAGLAPAEQWRSRAASTFGGEVHVASSGERFELSKTAAGTVALPR